MRERGVKARERMTESSQVQSGLVETFRESVAEAEADVAVVLVAWVVVVEAVVVD
jgi:hypothetical protein